jgi:hypothetical protein
VGCWFGRIRFASGTRHRRSQERAGGNELTEAEAGHPVQAAPPQLRRDIVPRLADFFELLGKKRHVERDTNRRRPASRGFAPSSSSLSRSIGIAAIECCLVIALSSPRPGSRSDFERLFASVALVADPKAAKARLQELHAATEAARQGERRS